jgi:hypothetical protein
MDSKFKKTGIVQMLSRDIDLTKNSDASVFFNKNQSNRAGAFFFLCTFASVRLWNLPSGGLKLVRVLKIEL